MRPIGLDHFAKPDDTLAVAQREGRLARNFQGYTTDSAPALIGFGASAISALPQGYAQNLADVPSYRKAMLAGGLATARGIALSDDDRLRRAIIERLMCDLEVDLDAVAAPFGRSARDFHAELALLVPLATGIVVRDFGPVLRVPPRPALACGWSAPRSMPISRRQRGARPGGLIRRARPRRQAGAIQHRNRAIVQPHDRLAFPARADAR